MFNMRLFALFFSILILSACGGGGGGSDAGGTPDPITVSDGDSDGSNDGDNDGQLNGVELVIEKSRKWVATDDQSTQTLALVPMVRTNSTEAFKEMTKGDIYWRISEGSEYASMSAPNRRGIVTATTPCPNDNPYCVEVEAKIITSTSDVIIETTRLLVKDSAENIVPTANAGADQTVTGGDQVFLDGSKGFDLDGEITNWSWDVVSGPLTKNQISGINTATPSFTAPESKYDQTIVLKLIVTDDEGDINDFDSTVTITILKSLENQTPVAVADQTQFSVLQGEKISFSCLNSYDSDEPSLVNCEWSELNEARSPETCPDITFSVESPEQPFYAYINAPDTGESVCHYKFNLTVTDSDNAQDSLNDEYISLIVTPPDTNQPPIAIAKAYPENSIVQKSHEITVNEEIRVCLTGTESSDPDNVEASLNYEWNQVATDGDTVELIPQDSSITKCFKAPTTTIQQTLKFQLVVQETTTTEKLPSEPSIVTVNVTPVNSDPIATLILQNENPVTQYHEITLDASESRDTDLNGLGTITKYEWQFISASEVLPEPITLTEIAPCENLETCRKVTFTPPVLGKEVTLQFQVTVYDNEATEETGFTTSDILEVIITPFDISPSNLTISAFDSTSADLAWNSQFAGIPYISFDIETSPDSESNWTTVNSSSETTNTITTLAEGETSYIRVRTQYQDGTLSAPSNIVAFMPETSDILLLDDVKTLQFSWNAVPGAEKYLVECELEGSTNCVVHCNEAEDGIYGETPTTQCTHTEELKINSVDETTKLIDSKQYSYTIKAVRNDIEIGLPSQPLQAYARANEWADISTLPDPMPKYELNLLNENQLYIIAEPEYIDKQNKSDMPRNIQILLNLDTHEWEHKAPLPDFRTGFASVSSNTTNLQYFVLGGVDYQNSCTTDIYYYDDNDEKNIWNILTDQNGIPVTTSSCRSYASIANTSLEDIYLIGGIDSEGNRLDSIEKYNLNDLIFNNSDNLPKLNHPRSDSKTIIFDNKLFVFGNGYNPNSTESISYNSIEMLDLDNPTEWILFDELPFDILEIYQDTINYIFQSNPVSPPIHPFINNGKLYLRTTETTASRIYEFIPSESPGNRWNHIDSVMYHHEDAKLSGEFSTISKNNIAYTFWGSYLLNEYASNLDYRSIEQYNFSLGSFNYLKHNHESIVNDESYISRYTSVTIGDSIYYLQKGTTHWKYQIQHHTWQQFNTSYSLNDKPTDSTIHNDKIYAVYHEETESQDINTIYQIDPTTGDTGKYYGPDTFLDSPCIVTIEDQIFLIGETSILYTDGLNENCTSTSCWKVFKNTRNETVTVPNSRTNLSCQYYENKLYLVTGTYNTFDQLVDVYDFEAESWSEQNMNWPRKTGKTAIINNRIYVLGGYRPRIPDNYVSTSIEYNDLTNPEYQWKIISELPSYNSYVKGAVRGFLSNKYKGTIILTGGYIKNSEYNTSYSTNTDQIKVYY